MRASSFAGDRGSRVPRASPPSPLPRGLRGRAAKRVLGLPDGAGYRCGTAPDLHRTSPTANGASRPVGLASQPGHPKSWVSWRAPYHMYGVEVKVFVEVLLVASGNGGLSKSPGRGYPPPSWPTLAACRGGLGAPNPLCCREPWTSPRACSRPFSMSERTFKGLPGRFRYGSILCSDATSKVPGFPIGVGSPCTCEGKVRTPLGNNPGEGTHPAGNPGVPYLWDLLPPLEGWAFPAGARERRQGGVDPLVVCGGQHCLSPLCYGEGVSRNLPGKGIGASQRVFLIPRRKPLGAAEPVDGGKEDRMAKGPAEGWGKDYGLTSRLRVM